MKYSRWAEINRNSFHLVGISSSSDRATELHSWVKMGDKADDPYLVNLHSDGRNTWQINTKTIKDTHIEYVINFVNKEFK